MGSRKQIPSFINNGRGSCRSTALRAARRTEPPAHLCPQSRRHQTCHFRKRATSAPAEGPAYGLDFARHCRFSIRALQAQKWQVHRQIHQASFTIRVPTIEVKSPYKYRYVVILLAARLRAVRARRRKGREKEERGLGNFASQDSLIFLRSILCCL